VGDNPRYPYKPRIPLTVVVNPLLEPVDDELVEINEGCLSVPNLRGSVMRHVNVRVRYLDRDGVAHDEVKRGLTAGTFQHECDHLDGVLFLDRVVDPRTFTTWEQFEKFHRAAFVERITEFVARVGS
jgi:peptide deformylase